MYGSLADNRKSIAVDCIPPGSLFMWSGNIDTPSTPRSRNEPLPLAAILDKGKFADNLAYGRFDFVDVEWVTGWLNPYVNITATNLDTFQTIEAMRNRFNTVLNTFYHPRMNEFRLLVRNGECRAGVKYPSATASGSGTRAKAAAAAAKDPSIMVSQTQTPADLEAYREFHEGEDWDKEFQLTGMHYAALALLGAGLLYVLTQD